MIWYYNTKIIYLCFNISNIILNYFDNRYDTKQSIAQRFEHLGNIPMGAKKMNNNIIWNVLFSHYIYLILLFKCFNILTLCYINLPNKKDNLRLIILTRDI